MDKFSDVLMTTSRQRGVARRAMARALGVSNGALKYWLDHNRFPPHHALRLARDFDLASSREELESRFTLAYTHKHPATQAEDDPDQPLGEIAQTTDVPAEIVALLEGLGDDGLYAYFSVNRLPDELTDGWAEIGPVLAGAISRGAACAYLYPDDAAGAHLAGCGLTVHRPEFWDAELKSLRGALSRATRHETNKLKLYGIPTGQLGFWNPDQACVLARSEPDAPWQSRILVSTLGGTLSLPNQHTASLVRMLENAAELNPDVRKRIRPALSGPSADVPPSPPGPGERGRRAAARRTPQSSRLRSSSALPS